MADCFPKCEGCCVCQCGSTTLQIVILFIMSSSSISARDNHQYAIAPSLAHLRFQLSRVGECSSMIVLCDSWRRLMRSSVLVKTSVFTLDGRKDIEPEPKEQFRALLLRSSSRLQPWQSRQPCVVAALPVLNVGQSVVSRGQGREQFCKSRMPVVAKSAVRRP